jgi:aminopeptidase N
MAGAAAPEFVLAFARALYPRFTNVEHSVLAGTDDLLENTPLAASVLKAVREERTELLIMRAARACDAAHGMP